MRQQLNPPVVDSMVLAQSVASRCMGIARGMELYQHYICSDGHDNLVAGLEVVMERLLIDWRLFLQQRDAEAR